MNMLLKLSASRKRIRLFHICTQFDLLLVQVRMCLVVIGEEIFSEKEMVSRSRDYSFFAKQCVPSPPNNKIVGFWSLEGIFKTLQQDWHFLQS